MAKIIRKYYFEFTLVIIGYFLYFHSLKNNFLGDDSGQLVSNYLVHSIRNFPSFFFGGTFAVGTDYLQGSYRPLMITFFSLIYTFFGPVSYYFHIFQLIIHLANIILLYKLFKYFFNKHLSFCLALVFLVHPMNVETVVYVSNLQDVLFFFFGMLSLHQILKKTITVKTLFLFSIFLLFSFLSKESAILFLLISTFYIYLFNKKYFFSLLKASSITFFIYLILRVFIAKISNSMNQDLPMQHALLIERLISIPAMIFYYIKTFVFPKDLATLQLWVVKTVNFSGFYFPLILEILFFSIIIRFGFYLKKYSKNFKVLLFFLSWFLFGLGIHLNIFPLDATVADRWFYFPMVGLLGIIGLVVENFVLVNKKFSKAFAFLFVIIVVVFIGRSFIRTRDWKDNLTLKQHDIKISDNFIMEQNLGIELLRVKKYDEAEMHIRQAKELNPNLSIFNSLGNIYAAKGDFKKAKEYYSNALIFQKDQYTAYQNMAALLFLKENPADAKKFTEEALVKFPKSVNLWITLAYANLKLNDKNAALSAAQKAYSLFPDKRISDLIKEIRKK